MNFYQIAHSTIGAIIRENLAEANYGNGDWPILAKREITAAIDYRKKVYYVGYAAFYGCWNLSQVSLPVCRYIEQSAFYHCGQMTVDLPICEYIGGYAFPHAYSIFLRYSSIVQLGYSAFGDPEGVINPPSIYVPESLYNDYIEYAQLTSQSLKWGLYSSWIYTIESLEEVEEEQTE